MVFIYSPYPQSLLPRTMTAARHVHQPMSDLILNKIFGKKVGLVESQQGVPFRPKLLMLLLISAVNCF